jgi:tRNA threonylcarbamoyladenosine biosynthesis protein TsaB
MKILAIDTSTMLGGIALMDDISGLIAEIRLNVKSTHSERLMTALDFALKQASISLSAIDAFAVATGPGSFTGLRIGLSTVKGLSYATGKPVVSVPTLEAFAYSFPFSRHPVCVMLDARRHEVYAAVFYWQNDGYSRLLHETSLTVEKLLEIISKTVLTHPGAEPSGMFYSDRIIFTGDGAVFYRDAILNKMGETAVFPSSGHLVSSPAQVACLGIKKALLGEFSEPGTLVPFYMRKSEAEIKADV